MSLWLLSFPKDCFRFIHVVTCIVYQYAIYFLCCHWSIRQWMDIPYHFSTHQLMDLDMTTFLSIMNYNTNIINLHEHMILFLFSIYLLGIYLCLVHLVNLLNHCWASRPFSNVAILFDISISKDFNVSTSGNTITCFF